MSDKPAVGNLGVTQDDATTSAGGQIDIRVELARIDRERVETQKFVAEQQKLMAEAAKLAAEERKLGGETAKMWAEAFKLDHEANKLQRDRFLSPWLAGAVIVGAVGGFIAGIQALLRLFGITS